EVNVARRPLLLAGDRTEDERDGNSVAERRDDVPQDSFEPRTAAHFLDGHETGEVAQGMRTRLRHPHEDRFNFRDDGEVPRNKPFGKRLSRQLGGDSLDHWGRGLPEAVEDALRHLRLFSHAALNRSQTRHSNTRILMLRLSQLDEGGKE